jgi:short-subunit dehydrogenase
MGFNIVLISRTESKLLEAAAEIKSIANVETRIIVADFTKSSEPGFIENIQK